MYIITQMKYDDTLSKDSKDLILFKKIRIKKLVIINLVI